MNNKHVTRYLNEDENIVSELKYLLKHIHKAMLRYLFNRHGRFFFVHTKDNEPTCFIKLKEKGKGHYEVVYVIAHEELWGKVLGTEALKQALYTAFLLNRAYSVNAMVHHENIRSLRTVNKCGFEIIDETGVYIKFRLTFEKYLKTLRNR